MRQMRQSAGELRWTRRDMRETYCSQLCRDGVEQVNGGCDGCGESRTQQISRNRRGKTDPTRPQTMSCLSLNGERPRSSVRRTICCRQSYQREPSIESGIRPIPDTEIASNAKLP